MISRKLPYAGKRSLTVRDVLETRFVDDETLVFITNVGSEKLAEGHFCSGEDGKYICSDEVEKYLGYIATNVMWGDTNFIDITINNFRVDKE